MDYDVEYNNRARVPEHPEIIAGWQKDAEAYRGSCACELDISYGASERTTLDLFFPGTGADDAPIAMFIHGGYWQAMDGKTFSSLARGLNQHGVAVAMPTYDLCPSVSIGDIVDQMRACCALLWKRFERPLTVFGHSAGGHLTAAMVATDWPSYDSALPADLCQRGYAISGVFELAPLLGTYLNEALDLDDETAKAWSPIAWPTARASHLTAAVGGLESSEFLRQSKDMCEAWRAAGIETAYRELDGKDHFTVIADLADPDSAMVREIMELVHRETPKGP